MVSLRNTDGRVVFFRLKEGLNVGARVLFFRRNVGLNVGVAFLLRSKDGRDDVFFLLNVGLNVGVVVSLRFEYVGRDDCILRL